MKESDDIANLFRHFGGQPGQYQEISRANEARQSRERWPLLASIEADQAARLPPVEAPVFGDLPQAPQPTVLPAAARPVAAPPAAEPVPSPAGRIEPHLSASPASPPPAAPRADAGVSTTDARMAPERGPEPQLQALFTRLARPAPQTPAGKKSESLLERLNRL
ncbi:cellulose biosynthesis protein BcsP [Pigmentiphaga sp. YJ18]|uniref:cellulose biosynthesis protein BcsP n=1 Tax=Pigmentiphaga sp. YJ18 TaxID=3134907 RepID=UPI0031137637